MCNWRSYVKFRRKRIFFVGAGQISSFRASGLLSSVRGRYYLPGAIGLDLHASHPVTISCRADSAILVIDGVSWAISPRKPRKFINYAVIFRFCEHISIPSDYLLMFSAASNVTERTRASPFRKQWRRLTIICGKIDWFIHV